jgi:hypothetical protein
MSTVRRKGPLRDAVLALPTPACVPWTGTVNNKGYGTGWSKTLGGGVAAHRVVYERVVGSIPSGMHLDHLCHNADRSCLGGVDSQHRRCVNPAHLEPVTTAENNRRSRQEAAS